MKFLISVLLLFCTVSASGSVLVDYSALRGEDFSTRERKLYASMLGVHTPVGNHRVNFLMELEAMWRQKLNRRGGVSPVTRDSWRAVVMSYSRRPSNLREFIGSANWHIDVVNRRLDWVGVCKEYRLNAKECQVFQGVVKTLDGKELVAYGMTELMPATDGKLNVEVLDALLRNAGDSYLFRIPAQYDKYLSFGFYQFTSLALNEDTSADASRVNRYLPRGNRIPGSVVMLTDTMQHRAAYLFAIGNIARVIKAVPQRNLADVLPRIKENPRAVVVFVATAHHAPAKARRSFVSWIQGGGLYRSYLRGRLVMYGRKTFNNLLALP